MESKKSKSVAHLASPSAPPLSPQQSPSSLTPPRQAATTRARKKSWDISQSRFAYSHVFSFLFHNLSFLIH